MSIAQALRSRFDELLEDFPVPAAEAVEALATLIRNDQAEQFLPMLTGEADTNRSTLRAIQDFYNQNPEACEKEWADLAFSFRSEYVATARRKLASLTKIELINTVERTQAEKTNLISDTRGALLELSVAEELLERLGDATRRSGLLQEWLVSQATSEEADQYLAEATSCFVYGFFTSCVVMCRSLLEEVLERKLPHSLIGTELRGSKRPTLGSLIAIVNNNMPKAGIALDVPELLRKVNDIGSQAAHQRPVVERKALECLDLTRLTLIKLLS